MINRSDFIVLLRFNKHGRKHFPYAYARVHNLSVEEIFLVFFEHLRNVFVIEKGQIEHSSAVRDGGFIKSSSALDKVLGRSVGNNGFYTAVFINGSVINRYDLAPILIVSRIKMQKSVNSINAELVKLGGSCAAITL